jgi:hypothetical protein
LGDAVSHDGTPGNGHCRGEREEHR